MEQQIGDLENARNQIDARLTKRNHEIAALLDKLDAEEAMITPPAS